MLAIICFMSIGGFVGIVFSLLLINFDSKWKLIIETVFGVGISGISITYLFSLYKITEQTQMFITTISFVFGFIICSTLLLFIMCKLIKDRDDPDILRIRDILLGQKSYINKYYQQRMTEIDNRLGIPLLEKREQAIRKKETELHIKENFLAEEVEKVESLNKERLRLDLPEKNKITLTKEYIDVMPSYINDIFHCVNSMNDYTKMFINELYENNLIMDISRLKSYLISIATLISNEIFGSNSSDVRVHFRYYIKNKDGNCGYEKLVAVIGNKVVSKAMTFIPYKDDSMIKKSYECKRALIKSINSEYDYSSNNYTTWQDYMTYTFYNLKLNEIPYLSFGISVKNLARYRKLFYFINFFMFENYLNDNIELLNEYNNIADVIYGGVEND